jgi:hypothetical protein
MARRQREHDDAQERNQKKRREEGGDDRDEGDDDKDKQLALAARPPPVANYWIVKPVGLSRGRGISLVRELSQVQYGDQVIVQQYVADPLLVHGYKFDMRLYVLVTSFNPLEAFIYEDGFARFTTTPYSIDPNKTDDLFVHLTNSSIQKHNPQAHKCPLYGGEGEGSKEDGGAGGAVSVRVLVLVLVLVLVCCTYCRCRCVCVCVHVCDCMVQCRWTIEYRE